MPDPIRRMGADPAPVNIPLVQEKSFGQKAVDGIKGAAAKCRDLALRILKAIGRGAAVVWKQTVRVILLPVNLAVHVVKAGIWGVKALNNVRLYVQRNPEVMAAFAGAVGALAVGGNPLDAVGAIAVAAGVHQVRQRNWRRAAALAGMGAAMIAPGFVGRLAWSGAGMAMGAAAQYPVVAGGMAAAAVGVVAARRYQGPLVAGMAKAQGIFRSVWEGLKSAYNDAAQQPLTIL